MGQASHEPSMEDILASIKRIIAEDSEAAGARPPKLRREAMAAVSASPVVMPLRPPVEPEAPADVEQEPEAVEPAGAATAEEAAPDEPPAETLPDQPAAESPDILELTSPMPETAAAAPSSPPSALADGLLSTTSEQASRAAFAALSQMQVRSDQGQSNTLEGLVADLLKPMLREWLDRELPALVERLVSAEVKRLASG